MGSGDPGSVGDLHFEDLEANKKTSEEQVKNKCCNKCSE